ncbi:putative apolipoprotein(a)-like protein 2 [Kryptolebias marmoratus]|uniref:putative apolipoprotein(a)-like protein 2 n=1 Tax=Kryptolebias marmoratus TaxID=37003 RepID=UPI0018ACF3C6|nr:putative apolipoprotein(a)-like protein 2 [Kryptolebias marmoratus]
MEKVLLFFAAASVSAQECFNNQGEDYRGHVSTTEHGYTCQRWDSQSPHSHPFTPAAYPQYFLEENYCRNPDGEPRPWCYTTNSSTRWEYCPIPRCVPVLKYVVKLQLMKSSSVDLNDPAVLKVLLKKLKQKLKDRGLDGDKVTWRKQLDEKIFY